MSTQFSKAANRRLRLADVPRETTAADRAFSAKLKRFGLRGRGPVRELNLTVGATSFGARVVRGRLQLTPSLAPAVWVDRLLTALSEEAAGDHDLRARLSRAGWKLRGTPSHTSPPSELG